MSFTVIFLTVMSDNQAICLSSLSYFPNPGLFQILAFHITTEIFFSRVY